MIKTKEVLEIFGFSQQYLSAIIHNEGFPKENRGQYDELKIISWLWEKIKKDRKERESKAASIERYNSAKADLMEMQVLEKKKELVTLEEITNELTPLFVATRQKLLALPDRLAPQLYGKQSIEEIKVQLQKGIWETMEEMASLPDTISNLYNSDKIEFAENKV